MANVTVASHDFGGDEFFNNLFSDLAPLLTLFGEQVTKQFLSMSLGLKALVGRARESLSTAEQELLSSTSPDVCELWSGKEVVRTFGSPAGMKILIVTSTESGEKDILDLASAFEQGLLTWNGLDSHDPHDKKLLRELRDAAPNLALNVKNATAPSWELWFWAGVGVLLQTTALVIPGIAMYVWKWEEAGIAPPPYGYPCFLVGALLVILRVICCGHVIEGVTTEHFFTVKTSDKQIEQNIESVTTEPSFTDKDKTIKNPKVEKSFGYKDLALSATNISHHSLSTIALTTSRYESLDSAMKPSRTTGKLNAPNLRVMILTQFISVLTVIATFFTLLGFVVQFIGLRAPHWSATIIQLGVTILMTGIRAYLRRGLATNPLCYPLLGGHDAASLTMQLFQGKYAVAP
ncbi:hypothetical protein OQA88_2966 [Cercophora sp. LCS_1]